MIKMSSEVIQDFIWCFGGIGGISRQNELLGEAGGEWGGGEELWNVAGQLGLGACQFGLSKCLQLWIGRSLWGGGSLQSLEWWGLGNWVPGEVQLSPQSAGGT